MILDVPIELDLMSDTSIKEASERIASNTDKLHLVVTTPGFYKMIQSG